MDEDFRMSAVRQDAATSMQAAHRLLANLGDAAVSPTPGRLSRGNLTRGRVSEIRDFALQTSITMSSMELDGLMDTSSTTSTFNPRSLPPQVSDGLYQGFLDGLQARGETFTAVSEFIHRCTNTLEVMRETHSDKELEWLELEMSSWRLLQCLYQNRLSPPDLGEEGEPSVQLQTVHPPSEKEIMENFYQTNPKIREYQLVIDWLERGAADMVDAHQGPKVHHFLDNTVAWENTLHQLQNETIAYRSSRDIVSRLDPDAPLRESKPLHDLDMEDEARLLKQVFGELRCGRHDRAQALCNHCGQQWRAASLEGWKLYHDPNYTTRLPSNEKLPVQGNPHRHIWKLCAWRLSENPRAGLYARAVYAALCGNLNALLPACHTWEDVLWAHSRVMVDLIVEKEIRDNSLREYTELPPAYWDNRLTMEDTFAQLDGHSNPSIRAQASARERVVQKLLILAQTSQLLTLMAQWARQPDCGPHMKRFLAHLVLVLRIVDDCDNQELGNEIIKLYVKVLMEQGEPRLVAYYTATLPADDQISMYAAYLQTVEQSELRRSALEAAEVVQLPVEAITQRVVENIRNEKSQGKSLALELSDELTEEDRHKISALEFVMVYPAQRAEALWQANAFIRTFLALGKTQAARLAFSQVPPDSIDQVMNQYQMEDDSLSVFSDCLSTKVSAAIQEYLSHKAYLDAQEGFADWFKHYHHARPNEPLCPDPTATFTEKVAYDHRHAAYAKELERWRAAMDHQTKCVKQQLYNVLLFPRGGWLSDSDQEDRLRAHQIKSLRSLCLPKMVLLLHTVLQSMGQYKEAIQLADLVVDEQHQLYKVYSKQQVGELLSKIRESSLSSLSQDRDPWAYPVSS